MLKRLHVSLSALPESDAVQTWLQEVARLEKGLDLLQRSFGGYNLPDAAEVAASDLQRDWNLPGYEDPKELLRQARSLRIDVLQMSNPFIVPGNGFGFYGTSYGGGWSGEFARLQQAVYSYENVILQLPLSGRAPDGSRFPKSARCFRRGVPRFACQFARMRNVLFVS